MDITMVVLRLIHVFAGIAWGGAAFLMVLVTEPYAKSLGAEGERFLGRLLSQSKYSAFMGISALLTTFAGILLYWRDSGGLQTAWIATNAGIVLTIGGAAGIGAWLVGMMMNGRSGMRLAALAKEMGGNPPTPAQAQEIRALQVTIERGSVWGTALMIVAVIGMAVARYV